MARPQELGNSTGRIMKSIIQHEVNNGTGRLGSVIKHEESGMAQVGEVLVCHTA